MSSEPEIDDGYLVIRKPPPENRPIKGTKCGNCGMKFDYNQAYGYHCPDLNCPMQSATVR